MAGPLRCDEHGGEHLADVLLTRLEDGATIALCHPAFVGLARVIVDDFDRRLEAATAAGITDEAAAADADSLEAALTDAEAVARLAAAGRPPTEPLGVSTVVRRGTSRRRREHERRRRAATVEAEADERAEADGLEAIIEATLADEAAGD